jgi:hypothetical protein
LRQKEGEEYNETVNELTERVLSGRARLGREDSESGREVNTAAEVGVQIISADQGGIPAAASVRKEYDADAPVRKQIETAVESWAKSSGYWISEDEVAKSSHDGKMLAEGGESRVYLSPDGNTITKYNEGYKKKVYGEDGVVIEDVSERRYDEREKEKSERKERKKGEPTFGGS